MSCRGPGTPVMTNPRGISAWSDRRRGIQAAAAARSAARRQLFPNPERTSPTSAAGCIRWEPNSWRQSAASKSEAHSSASGTAGAVGGARLGSSRQSRIACVTWGGWIAASSHIRPPQRGHSSTSTAKTRRRSSAQASRRGRRAGSPGAGEGSSGLRGVRVGGASAGLESADGLQRSEPSLPALPRALVSLGGPAEEASEGLPGGGRAGSSAWGAPGTTRSRSLAHGPRTPW